MTEETTTAQDGLGNMAGLLGGMGVPASITDGLAPPPVAVAPVAVAPEGAPPVVAAPVAPVAVTPAVAVPEVAVAPVAPVVEPPVAVAPVVETPEQAFSATLNSTIFGGELQVGSPTTDAPAVQSFESMETFNAYLEKDHGIKSAQDLPAQIKEWKENGGKVEELNTQVNNLNAVFTNMPPELYTAVEDNLAGKDWRAGLNSSRIDFTKNMADLSQEQIVEVMSPGTLTTDDWKEYKDTEGDPAIKRLVENTIKTSEASYGAKQTAVNQASTAAVAKGLEHKANVQASIEAAKIGLKEQFEHVDPTYTNTIAKMFEDGSINSLFYESDGTLKKDAFARATMARDGKGLIEQWEGIARNKAITEATQEILSRGATTPTTSQGSAAVQAQDGISEEVKALDGFIRGMGVQSTY